MKQKAPKSKKSLCIGGTECERLGYCIVRHARYKAEAAEREKAFRMKESFIGKMIPLRVIEEPFYYIGAYSRQHLQVAFDAYHQMDYETAILHCKAVMQANDKCGYAYICIAVSEYYLGNYEEASYYADRGSYSFTYVMKRILDDFSLHCVNLHREKTIAIEIPPTPVKEKPLQLDLFTSSSPSLIPGHLWTAFV